MINTNSEHIGYKKVNKNVYRPIMQLDYLKNKIVKERRTLTGNKSKAVF